MEYQKSNTKKKQDATNFCGNCGQKLIKARKNRKHIIFISHAEEDKKIAKALKKLLHMILNMRDIKHEVFCTSVAGAIECGENTYEAIVSSLDESDNIFCLLTDNSYNRPWVMFEIGYAKGKYDGKQLMPIVVNMQDKTKLNNKPYSYWRLESCERECIIAIMIQLLKRIQNKTDVNNKSELEECLSPYVSVFLTNLKRILKELQKNEMH